MSSAIRTTAIRAVRAPIAARPLSTNVPLRNVVDKAKDTLKAADRVASNTILKGIETTEHAAESLHIGAKSQQAGKQAEYVKDRAMDAAGEVTGDPEGTYQKAKHTAQGMANEASGKVSEMAGKGSGMANEMAGKGSGMASEMAGKAKGMAKEAQGAAEGTYEKAKREM